MHHGKYDSDFHERKTDYILDCGIVSFLFAIVMSYGMVQDYRIYLDENYKARYSFCDFIKRGRYYIYLFLGLTFVIILEFTVYIMAE